ncbi:hypothetical protein, partial [uncultured Helicobacter sp.]|uniref:hypothetical protein n=1 Tax=uncultured Helicobacter sp. TaxID=175537 RepID=UPI0026F3F33F
LGVRGSTPFGRATLSLKIATITIKTINLSVNKSFKTQIRFKLKFYKRNSSGLQNQIFSIYIREY